MKLSMSLLCAGLLLVAAPAFAEGECTTDADCPGDQTCEIRGSTGGSTDCPPCESGAEECTNCAVVDEGFCAEPPPPPCESDADCSDGTTCVQFTVEACSVSGTPACLPGEECEVHEPTEPDCTSETLNLCVPPYLAPCTVDVDCGTGFTCDPVEMCTCSSAPGGTEEASCECEPSGDFYCALIHVECDADSDCPADFECVEGPDTPTIACDPADSCAAPEPQPSYCAPVGYEGYQGSVDDAAGNGTITGGERENSSGAPAANSDAGTKDDAGGCSSVGNVDAKSPTLLGLLLGALLVGRRRSRNA